MILWHLRQITKILERDIIKIKSEEEEADADAKNTPHHRQRKLSDNTDFLQLKIHRL